jgi:ribosomal protein S27E
MDFVDPSIFISLTYLEKEEMMNKIIIESEAEHGTFKTYSFEQQGFVDIPCYIVPKKFKQDPGDISVNEMKEILVKYEGEKLAIKKVSVNNDYTKLYRFIKRHCIDCGEDSMCFSYGDKSYTYVCLKCNQEKEFFHRHGRQYMYDPDPYY